MVEMVMDRGVDGGELLRGLHVPEASLGALAIVRLTKVVRLVPRHTAVLRLAEAGCSTLEVATVTGHSPATVDQIMKHYWLPSRGQAAAAFKKRLEHEEGQ